MAQPCSICNRKDREKIDRELLQGTSLRDIAVHFGTSKSSLQRHKDSGHIPASIAKAQEAKEIAKGDDLLRYVKGILGKAVSYMNQAEAAGDLRTACSAIREARGCVELLGKVTGELDNRSQLNVQVNVPSMRDSPEWPIFIRIIEKHPTIRAELNQALLEAGK